MLATTNNLSLETVNHSGLGSEKKGALDECMTLTGSIRGLLPLESVSV